MSAEQHEQQFGESSRLPKIADLRRAQQSDASQTSSRAASLEAAMLDNLALEKHLESTTAGEPPKQSLRRLLSTKSVVSTSSSFAERQQAAVGTNTAFREIGTGSIGKVFEHPGTVWAYKLPLTDDASRLWNNYIMNRRIENSFGQLGPLAGQVEVPRAVWYAKSTTAEFWAENLDRFPFTSEFQRRRRDVLCIERIFPLPKPTRDSLVDLYCPEIGREAAKIHAANKDCLLRPLLGRKRQSAQSRLSIFSLRNFKLHLDQIEEIGLDAQDLAFALADALAVLHWHTQIDAMDVEFVLGSSPQEDQRVRRIIPLEKLMTSKIPTSTFEYVTNSNANFSKRVTSLWLLDFDACSDITMDQTGVDMACKAFIETEAYYPRPHNPDPFAQQLWKDFGNRYLTTAGKIVHEGYKELPVQFLRAVNQALNRRSMPQPLGAPAVYTPRGASGHHPERGSASRGQSPSSSHPGVYNPTGSVRENPDSSSGRPSGSRYGEARRGRDDGGLSRHHGARGSHNVGGFRGRGDGRRGSGSHASEGSSRWLGESWRG